MLDGNGDIIFTSQHKEKELREGDDHPEFVHAFNAYSPPGTVEGDLVYVHYARVEDIRKLKTELGIDLKGKICMARYGKIFRGNKVKNCQDAGAIGVIIFSDPGDVKQSHNPMELRMINDQMMQLERVFMMPAG